jgi:hypothetical protein
MDLALGKMRIIARKKSGKFLKILMMDKHFLKDIHILKLI